VTKRARLPTFDEVYGRFIANMKARARRAKAMKQLSRSVRQTAQLKAEGKLEEARKALATADRWLKRVESAERRIRSSSIPK
jgi:hypothetical protein